MSFSLRLTADLAFACVARAVGFKDGSDLIHQICADELFNSESTQAAVPAVGDFRAPIVWISGSDALDYPRIAPFAQSLAVSGRHIFLETSGLTLRPRLHEFQPSPNFCFAIRFNSGLSVQEQRTGFEALRMARLAGFYSCARVVLHTGFWPTQLKEIHEKLRACDVDGILVTSADSNAELVKQTAALRREWLNRSCAILSSLLDSSLASQRFQSSTNSTSSSHPKPQHEALGEEVEAG